MLEAERGMEPENSDPDSDPLFSLAATALTCQTKLWAWAANEIPQVWLDSGNHTQPIQVKPPGGCASAALYLQCVHAELGCRFQVLANIIQEDGFIWLDAQTLQAQRVDTRVWLAYPFPAGLDYLQQKPTMLEAVPQKATAIPVHERQGSCKNRGHE